MIEKESNHNIGVKCNYGNCLTCGDISHEYIIKSSSTNYFMCTNNFNNPNCNSKNIVYCLTCKICGIQYIGESSCKLKNRINNHRSAYKSGKNTLLYEHYRNHGLQTFQNVFHLHILDDSTENSNNKIRTDKELYWIKLLKTAFPFGLNDKIKNFGIISTGFPKNILNSPYTDIKIEPPKKNRGNRKTRKNRTKINFDLGEDHIKNLDYKEIYNLSFNIKKKKINHFFRSYYSDDPLMEATKYAICQKYMRNKGKIQKNYNNQNLKLKIPYLHPNIENFNFKKLINIICSQENVQPKRFEIQYEYGETLGQIFYNYNKFLKQSERYSNLRCVCNQIKLTQNNSYSINGTKHLITGNPEDIESIWPHTAKILTKGTKFRLVYDLDNRKISLKAKKIIKSSLSKISDKISNDLNVDVVYSEIKNFLETREYEKDIKQISWTEIKDIAKALVITPIDKAVNNFCLTCPVLYFNFIEEELRTSIDTRTGTYVKHLSENVSQIIDRHEKTARLFSNKTYEKEPEIPVIYGLPKFHKSPIKFRFITGAYNSSVKPLSHILLKILKLFKEHFSNYCKSIHRNSGNKVYWTIQNSSEVDIKKANKDNSINIYTADFSNLFTSLPHDIVLRQMYKLADICFKNAQADKIEIGYKKCYYTNSPRNEYIEKSQVYFLIRYILENSFIKFKTDLLRQIKGIPQGNSASPLIADMTLAMFEFEYLKENCSSNYSGFRYMDDILILHKVGYNVENLMNSVYPSELNLEKTNKNTHECEFLDLNLYTKNGCLEKKLFNKTDNFNFAVARYQQYSSNISYTIKHSCFIGEIIRSFRSCSNKDNFIESVSKIFKILVSNTYPKEILLKVFYKTVNGQHNIGFKLGIKPKKLLQQLVSIT